MQLQPLIDYINAQMHIVNLEPIAKKYRVKELCDIQYMRMMDDSHCGLYYKALLTACQILKAQNVCELGTFHGGSAICMAEYGGKVTTYDIDTSNAIVSLQEFNITQVKIMPEALYSIDYSHYDFIHVDIAHAGPEELRLHQLFLEQEYKGFVFWDDTLWPGMRRFWEQVDVPKIETNWHSSSGYGVTLYE